MSIQGILGGAASGIGSFLGSDLIAASLIGGGIYDVAARPALDAAGHATGLLPQNKRYPTIQEEITTAGTWLGGNVGAAVGSTTGAAVIGTVNGGAAAIAPLLPKSPGATTPNTSGIPSNVVLLVLLVVAALVLFK